MQFTSTYWQSVVLTAQRRRWCPATNEPERCLCAEHTTSAVRDVTKWWKRSGRPVQFRLHLQHRPENSNWWKGSFSPKRKINFSCERYLITVHKWKILLRSTYEIITVHKWKITVHKRKILLRSTNEKCRRHHLQNAKPYFLNMCYGTLLGKQKTKFSKIKPRHFLKTFYANWWVIGSLNMVPFAELEPVWFHDVACIIVRWRRLAIR